MFDCKACPAKNDEIKHLRSLVDKFMKVQSPILFHMDNEGTKGPLGYYGDGKDQIEAVNEFGEPVALSEDDLNNLKPYKS